MKILIARLNHETNTFSPVPTPLEAFSPAYGAQALQENEGMRTAMAAFIDLAKGLGATLVTPVSAMANPSGPVHAAAYDELTRRIVDAAPGCDAILLDLHGAMVAENSPDGEGDLLERLRAAAPGVPVGVALDLHGNITPKMVANADVMVGFKTYPHIDMYETGEHTGRLLLAMLHGQARYTVRWHPLPMMGHTLRSTTLQGAMLRAVDAARAAEAGGIPAVTVFAGFSLADIEAPCMSVVVTAPADDPEPAQAAADRIAAAIWSERAEFVYDSEPLDQSLQRAQAWPWARTARCCCWTTATTACPAAPAMRWTCCRRRSPTAWKTSPWARCATPGRSPNWWRPASARALPCGWATRCRSRNSAWPRRPWRSRARWWPSATANTP